MRYCSIYQSEEDLLGFNLVVEGFVRHINNLDHELAWLIQFLYVIELYLNKLLLIKIFAVKRIHFKSLLLIFICVYDFKQTHWSALRAQVFTAWVRIVFVLEGLKKF